MYKAIINGAVPVYAYKDSMLECLTALLEGVDATLIHPSLSVFKKSSQKFVLLTIKSPSFTQRLVFQENAFKKSNKPVVFSSQNYNKLRYSR